MKKTDVLLIDFSVVRERARLSLNSAHAVLNQETDLEQVRYNMARRVLEGISLVRPKVVIMAMDYRVDGKRSYWREPVMTEWYLKNVRQFHSKTTDTYYLRMDNYYRPCILEGRDLVEIGKGLTIKQRPKDLCMIKGKERFTEEELRKVLPTYKGHRPKDEWNYEMDRGEYDAEMLKIPYDLAGACLGYKGIEKALVINAEGAEADDIAGVLTETQVARTFTLMTIDEDWFPLISDRVQVLNMMDMQLKQPLENPDEHFMLKVLGGDFKDNIKGTWIEGKAKRLGKTGKATLMYIQNPERRVELNQEAIARNYQLLKLDCKTIPNYVQARILAQCKIQSLPEKTWRDFNIGKVEENRYFAGILHGGIR